MSRNFFNRFDFMPGFGVLENIIGEGMRPQTEQMSDAYKASLINRFNRASVELNDIFNEMIKGQDRIRNEAQMNKSESNDILSNYANWCTTVKNYFPNNKELNIVLAFLIQNLNYCVKDPLIPHGNNKEEILDQLDIIPYEEEITDV